MLDQALIDLAEQTRRFEECRHMVETLRSENQRLSAALQQYTNAGGQHFVLCIATETGLLVINETSSLMLDAPRRVLTPGMLDLQSCTCSHAPSA